MQEPEALLGEGERQAPAPVHPRDGRGGHSLPFPVQPGRQTGHRRFLEQSPQRQLDPEGVPHAGQEQGRQERMPAEVEEVVLHPHPLQVQDSGPQSRQQLLHRRPRRLEGAHRVRGLRRREAAHPHRGTGANVEPLGHTLERDLAHRPAGLGGEPCQQGLEVVQEPPRRGRIEEIEVVLQGDGEPFPRLGDKGREVELRRAGLDFRRAQREARQLHGRQRDVLHRENDLDQGIARGIALRLQVLNEDLEREVLAGVSGERLLPHPAQQRPRVGRGAEVRAQRQGIDEEADQALDLRPAPVRGGGAEQQVVLAGVARQQRRKARAERHEEGGALFPAQRPQALDEVQGELPRLAGATEALRRRSRPVGGQIEHRRRPGEPPAPGCEPAFERGACQPSPLPDGEVRVLDRQVLEGQLPVQGRQLAEDDPHRLTVGDDVVQGQKRGVLLRRERQQGDPHQGTGLKVERPPRLFGDQPLRFPIPRGRGKAREVDHRRRQVEPRRHPLPRLPRHLGEHGPQGLVTAGDCIESFRQSAAVEPSREADGGGHVVDGAPGSEPVEEPEALLGEGERGSFRIARDGRQGRESGEPPPLLHLPGQVGEDRELEHGA